MNLRSACIAMLGLGLAAGQPLAQPTGDVSDKVIPPLKRQAPSAAASAGAMQRSLASRPRAAPSPSVPTAVTASAALATAAQGGPEPTAPPLAVVVTVAAIKPLDAAFDPAATQARITIAGDIQDVTQSGPPEAPTWTARKIVGGGRIAIRLHLFDGPSDDRPIDFNRAADRRHHDFIVDTATCRILGFSGTPSCGEAIVRAGTKPRRAEVTLTVGVTR